MKAKNLLIVSVMGLTSCHVYHPSTGQSLVKSPYPSSNTFHQVVLRGVGQVEIVNHSTSLFQLKQDASSPQKTAYSIKNDILTVYFPNKPGAIAKIQTPCLTRLDILGSVAVRGNLHQRCGLSLQLNNGLKTLITGQYTLTHLIAKGQGEIALSGLNSPYLQLQLNDNVRLKLEGNIHLKEAHLSDNAYLSAYWIQSPLTTLRMKGTSQVQLGGVMGRLDATLWDSARMNVQYIRANDVYVTTYDASHALLSTIGHQHAVARDKSAIDYFNLPKDKIDLMEENGAVLDFSKR